MATTLVHKQLCKRHHHARKRHAFWTDVLHCLIKAFGTGLEWLRIHWELSLRSPQLNKPHVQCTVTKHCKTPRLLQNVSFYLIVAYMKKICTGVDCLFLFFLFCKIYPQWTIAGFLSAWAAVLVWSGLLCVRLQLASVAEGCTCSRISITKGATELEVERSVLAILALIDRSYLCCSSCN